MVKILLNSLLKCMGDKYGYQISCHVHFAVWMVVFHRVGLYKSESKLALYEKKPAKQPWLCGIYFKHITDLGI